MKPPIFAHSWCLKMSVQVAFRCAKSGNVFSQLWIDVVEKFVLGVFYRDKKGLFS